jgi:hypothetical protein
MASVDMRRAVEGLIGIVVGSGAVADHCGSKGADPTERYDHSDRFIDTMLDRFRLNPPAAFGGGAVLGALGGLSRTMTYLSDRCISRPEAFDTALCPPRSCCRVMGMGLPDNRS